MSKQNGTSISRRLFRPAAAKPTPALRPPWTDEETIAAACTKCGDCVSACPERIIVRDAQGLPAVDFQRSGCTFCGACADACPAPVFDRSRPAPWALRAQVTTACLAAHGVVCQSCRDACPANAIHFRPRAGGVSLPGVMAQSCTGCGGCVSVCPADAIALLDAMA